MKSRTLNRLVANVQGAAALSTAARADVQYANTQYAVHLFDADTCGSFGKVASFATNGAGVGRSASRPVSVAGSDRFYAVAFDTSNFVGLTHGSLAVDLP